MSSAKAINSVKYDIHNAWTHK